MNLLWITSFCYELCTYGLTFALESYGLNFVWNCRDSLLATWTVCRSQRTLFSRLRYLCLSPASLYVAKCVASFRTATFYSRCSFREKATRSRDAYVWLRCIHAFLTAASSVWYLPFKWPLIGNLSVKNTDGNWAFDFARHVSRSRRRDAVEAVIKE